MSEKVQVYTCQSLLVVQRPALYFHRRVCLCILAQSAFGSFPDKTSLHETVLFYFHATQNLREDGIKVSNLNGATL